MSRRYFKLFDFGCSITDDTVCTVAIADALLNDSDIAGTLRVWCRKYPGLGYGSQFNFWVHRKSAGPYNSWGNGGAMRVSPCGWLATSLNEVELLAERTAVVTHNHEEGLRGALAVDAAIWYARQGLSANAMQFQLQARYGYTLGMSVVEHAAMEYGGTDAAETVPITLDCALQANSVADAICSAVFIGGDSDTTASMAAAIAEARFGIPLEQKARSKAELPDDMLAVVMAFERAVGMT